jgi:uncharacterized protein (TIGR00251 family)
MADTHPQGPRGIKVRAVPNARKTAWDGKHGDAWKLKVAAPAQEDRANAEILRFIATMMGVPQKSAVLLSGQKCRDKVIAVTGFTAQEIERRIS